MKFRRKLSDDDWAMLIINLILFSVGWGILFWTAVGFFVKNGHTCTLFYNSIGGGVCVGMLRAYFNWLILKLK